ncbi:MAG: TRAP transporter permease [Bdellovibrionota bacterium]
MNKNPSNALRAIAGIVAFSWALFQLIIPLYPINDTLVRSLHLSFAMFLVFFQFPLGNKKPLQWLHLLFSILGCFSALYLFLDYEGLSSRPGMPLWRDLLVSVVGIALLLEASRRSLGIALPILVVGFIMYCFFGPYMPEIISHRGASFSKTMDHLYLTTEGVFGVPLRVSASFVFLFVLLGSLLEKAGASKYFIDLSFSLLGKFRAGPAKAAVVASGLTGMISGSSIANTVTTGTFTIPLMKKIGFTPEKAAAIEVAASTNGQLMPPLMGAAAFIIAEFLGISYIDVVKASVIPAFVSYIGLFFLVHFESFKINLKPYDGYIEAFASIFIKGIHFLLPIAALVISLAWLKLSATLAAFYACLCVLGLMLIKNSINIIQKKTTLYQGAKIFACQVYDSMTSGSKNMVPISIATATAGMIVGTITLTGLGQSMINVIEMLSFGNIYLVLIMVALTCLILGMGLPTTANYIVVSSVSAPIILQLGIKQGFIIPAIAAHLFVFYFGILADDTPPVGLAAYAAAGIAKSNPVQTGIQGFLYDIRTAILPFAFVFNPNLLLLVGVKEQETGFYASHWIWIESPLQMIGIFMMATVGMIAFVSSISGYMRTKLSATDRILLLIVSYYFFRFDQMMHQKMFMTILHCLGMVFMLFIVLYRQWPFLKRKAI